MSNATRISNEKAKEVLKAQFAPENRMTIQECADLLGKHKNTILKLAKRTAENKRNGIDDPDDFPAIQTEPRSPYTILFSDLKIWCNRKGMRL